MQFGVSTAELAGSLLGCLTFTDLSVGANLVAGVTVALGALMCHRAVELAPFKVASRCFF